MDLSFAYARSAPSFLSPSTRRFASTGYAANLLRRRSANDLDGVRAPAGYHANAVSKGGGYIQQRTNRFGPKRMLRLFYSAIIILPFQGGTWRSAATRGASRGCEAKPGPTTGSLSDQRPRITLSARYAETMIHVANFATHSSTILLS